jgi:hypothetical protein
MAYIDRSTNRNERKHPWFKVSYPRYLELYPEEETAMDLKYLEPHVINELELVCTTICSV